MFHNDRIWRLVSLPMQEGMSPVSKFSPTDRPFKPEMLQIEFGSEPAIWFQSSSRVPVPGYRGWAKFRARPKLVGMLPLMLLLFKSLRKHGEWGAVANRGHSKQSTLSANKTGRQNITANSEHSKTAADGQRAGRRWHGRGSDTSLRTGHQSNNH